MRRPALSAPALVLAVLTLAACARPVISPSPPAEPPTATLASLALAATGTEPCGIVPDWGCMYVIQVQGPDGAVHEGWFDDGGIVGDVPTHLGEGGHRITFLKQRVSDLSSLVPVPGGTPACRTGATCSRRARRRWMSQLPPTFASRSHSPSRRARRPPP